MFRLNIFEADGQAYEDLFVKIMRYAFPGFRPVRAHGPVGDKKNDGFEGVSGTYYQVYAPENIKNVQGGALKKLRRDFKELKAFWNGLYPVKRYFFVINDKYQGVSPSIEAELVAIRARYSLNSTGVLLAGDLEEILFKLNDDVIISVVGHVPVIMPAEFMFLSGFTYFLGAWIDFEKTIQALAVRLNIASGTAPPMTLIRAIKEKALLNSDDVRLLDTLRKKRNTIVHGDRSDVPLKHDIDRLVVLTEALKTF
jgi:hypothetical protein